MGLNGPTMLRACMCVSGCVWQMDKQSETGKKLIFAYILRVDAHFFIQFKSGSRCFKWDCQETHLAGCHAAVKSFHSQPGATTAQLNIDGIYNGLSVLPLLQVQYVESVWRWIEHSDFAPFTLKLCPVGYCQRSLLICLWLVLFDYFCRNTDFRSLFCLLLSVIS